MELLVRVIDKVHATDPVLDGFLLKAGDVVVVCVDGWPWSETEKTNPEWRIVKIPGVDPSKYGRLVDGDSVVLGVSPEAVREGAVPPIQQPLESRRRISGLDVSRLKSVMTLDELHRCEVERPRRGRGIVEL